MVGGSSSATVSSVTAERESTELEILMCGI
jgi:hypothetical protein